MLDINVYYPNIRIDYANWCESYKKLFITMVVNSLLNKYNIDLLEIYPKITEIGGSNINIIANDLRNLNQFDSNVIYDICDNIHDIYNTVYLNMIQVYPDLIEDKKNILSTYVIKLADELKMLKPIVSENHPDEFVCLSPKLTNECNSVHEYIIYILNNIYGYAGKDYNEIITNIIIADKIHKEIVGDIISNLINAIDNDIKYFKNWEKEINKALE